MPFRDNTRDLPERYGYKRFLTGWHEIRQALYEPVADLVQFEHKVRHSHGCSSAVAHAKLQCRFSARCCPCHTLQLQCTQVGPRWSRLFWETQGSTWAVVVTTTLDAW